MAHAATNEIIVFPNDKFYRMDIGDPRSPTMCSDDRKFSSTVNLRSHVRLHKNTKVKDMGTGKPSRAAKDASASE
ncbi:MAG: hypothetical protein M1819_003578 [Sarea resinae]|nr:MAG: hypothetical protein M1819_003578 [Sarea resinae]